MLFRFSFGWRAVNNDAELVNRCIAMSAAESRLTPQEYLEIERASRVKHEFHAGRMYAMAGTSVTHNLIAGNIFGTLYAQLGGSECVPFVSDLRVKVDTIGSYVYPDVVVACGALQCEDHYGDTLLNPQVVIEVLSPSTEAYDLGEKFRQYREIASLQEYVLVSQEDYMVELFSRAADGRWMLSDARGLDARVALPSLGCELPLNRIYARVEITSLSRGEIQRRLLAGKPGGEPTP